jgi:hypothetical protein
MNKIYNPIKITLLAALLLFAGGCKMETVNLNAPEEDDVLSTREGIIGLSVGLRQFQSTSGINAAYFYPAVTAKELQGVATFTNVLELEAGGTALPTANGNILTLWSNMQRLMTMSQNVIDNAPQVSTLTGGLLSGIIANAQLFKAISLGTLASSFEQANINIKRKRLLFCQGHRYLQKQCDCWMMPLQGSIQLLQQPNSIHLWQELLLI